MQANQRPRAGREKIFHRLFRIGIWLKGIDGVLEIAGGILLLMVSLPALILFTQAQIQHDAGDLVARALRHIISHLTANSKLVGVSYLLGNGVVKVFLAASILRGKLWSYPVAIVVLGLFILLQCGRLGFHFSYLMLCVTAIDTAIVLLIWREYRLIRRNPHVAG